MNGETGRVGSDVASPAVGLTGFFKRLAQYYSEFLSTDSSGSAYRAAGLRRRTPRGG